MATVVFGARGNVGRHVAAGLLAAGEQVGVTSRHPSTARFPPQLQVAAADLEEPGTLPAALAGAGNVFLYAKPVGIQGFVEAARAAGARHAHSGRAYTVYGPQSLTLRQQVRHIGDAIGREISLSVIAAGQARQELAASTSPAAADAVMGAWRAGNGGPAPTSVIVEKITGRPARRETLHGVAGS
jgi:uncharacterized protein YbjT (DUF2867 family)